MSKTYVHAPGFVAGDRPKIVTSRFEFADSFTLAHAECQAACTEAPTLQVNYRYRLRVTPADLDNLIDNLKAGKLNDEFPAHGVLAKVRQTIPAERAVGAKAPEDVTESPAWLDGKAAL